jgi:hypothetical protein
MKIIKGKIKFGKSFVVKRSEKLRFWQKVKMRIVKFGVFQNLCHSENLRIYEKRAF